MEEQSVRDLEEVRQKNWVSNGSAMMMMTTIVIFISMIMIILLIILIVIIIEMNMMKTNEMWEQILHWKELLMKL